MSWCKPARGDWAAFIGFVLLAAVVYHKAWLRGQVYFGGDLLRYHGPMLDYMGQRVKQGQIPQWNPYLYGGTPFIASPQTGVFYPANWIGAILAPQHALTVLAAGHLTLAAVLMFYFCRGTLKCGATASFLAAISFGYAGNLSAHFEHTAVLMSGAWLPGILLACYRGFATGRWSWYAVAGIQIGLSILAGGVQFVYLTGVAIMVLAICNLVWPIDRVRDPVDATAIQNRSAGETIWRWCRPHAIDVRRQGAGLFVAGFVAACLGCAQLMPTASFVSQSQRAQSLDFAAATEHSLPPIYSLILSICPHFFGHKGTIYWGAGNQHEYSMYLGVLIWSTALLAVTRLLQSRWVIHLFVLALVSLVLSFGRNSFVYEWALDALPGLGYLRVPARFLFLFSFSGAALGAVGIELLVQRNRAARITFLIAIGSFWLLAGAWGIYQLTRQDLFEHMARLSYEETEGGVAFKTFLVGRLARELVAGQPYYWYLFFQTLCFGVMSVIAIGLVMFRRRAGRAVAVVIMLLDVVVFQTGLPPWALAGEGAGYAAPAGWVPDLNVVRGNNRCGIPEALLPPNVPMLYRLPVLDGYDPLLPQQRHTILLRAFQERGAGAANRLDQLFARSVHVISGAPDLDANSFQAGQSVRVMHNSTVPPRARLIATAETAADGPAALERLLADDFDPARHLVVEPPILPSSATQTEPTLHAISNTSQSTEPERTDHRAVRWVIDTPEQLKLEVQSSRHAWLVISDAYWPKWRAWVNGREVPVQRANYYFRAIAVEPGPSIVEMRYVDWSIPAGAFASLVTCLVAAWYIVRERVRHGV